MVVARPVVPQRLVTSILDAMADDGSYASLIDTRVNKLDMRGELRRAIADVEAIRGRPLLIYASNVVRPGIGPHTAIDQNDDLPFAEMVAAVPPANRDIDLLVVTPGGSAQQVSLFVDKLRRRFDHIGFLIPSQCMSAGTIWALSADDIWMDERAYIGPIDPQVLGRDGRWIPAQALLVLLKDIQDKGAKSLSQGQNPDWSLIQLLRNIDPKEIGNTISVSAYSIQLAKTYLNDYKFKTWVTHSGTGAPVTDVEKMTRATEIAAKLCDHEKWKTHGHGISREIASNELQLKVEHPETVPGLQRALRRLWTLLYWSFENTAIIKVYVSQTYAIFRNQAVITP
jgi:hypothetical protein